MARVLFETYLGTRIEVDDVGSFYILPHGCPRKLKFLTAQAARRAVLDEGRVPDQKPLRLYLFDGIDIEPVDVIGFGGPRGSYLLSTEGHALRYVAHAYATREQAEEISALRQKSRAAEREESARINALGIPLLIGFSGKTYKEWSSMMLARGVLYAPEDAASESKP